MHMLVLAWAATWFVVIVPAHQRGVVTIPGAPGAPGAERPAASCASCCESEGDTPPGKSDDPVRRCAVCHIVAKLDVPPAIEWFSPRLGRVHCLPIDSPAEVFAMDAPRTIQGRAPPAIT